MPDRGQSLAVSSVVLGLLGLVTTSVQGLAFFGSDAASYPNLPTVAVTAMTVVVAALVWLSGARSLLELGAQERRRSQLGFAIAHLPWLCCAAIVARLMVMRLVA